MKQPFNEAKYKVLMEGLEAVEFRLSDFLYDNIDFRIDSEYFLKSNLFYLEKIKEVGYKLINDFAYVTDGIHSSIDYCEKSNVKLISATSPRENYFDTSRDVFISEIAHSKNPRTALKENDIILSTVGTIGNCAVVTKNILPANSDRHVGIIRCNEEFLPNYISTFLLTKYGRFQTWRESTGNVQLNLFIYKIRTIRIANLSSLFQREINILVKTANINRDDSLERYIRAELILLKTLGLNDFEPSQEPINIKSFSESFGSSGRLDAEYYQKKYENYHSLVSSYSKGYDSFATVCILKNEKFTPKDNIEYKYIELSNIGKAGEITGCTLELGKLLPTRARLKVNTNDVIISSIEGSLESCALVTPEYNNAICSTGFYVVNSKMINPETLLVLFKSRPIQNLMKKGCSGTILTAISKNELERIPIPLVDLATQEVIKKHINESFKLKKQSEHLLEIAKRAVEMAIEENEETAIEYIERSTKIAEMS
ncbi:MAG: restriction endonuclease subunit S [Candidatus Kapabacteria bacterium]|nr:restriction endonuclease subunit S [Candidatus Kapabacteria bacterium]